MKQANGKESTTVSISDSKTGFNIILRLKILVVLDPFEYSSTQFLSTMLLSVRAAMLSKIQLERGLGTQGNRPTGGPEGEREKRT